eukprot:5222498-Ditylum_brightwellii.AAC.1
MRSKAPYSDLAFVVSNPNDHIVTCRELLCTALVNMTTSLNVSDGIDEIVWEEDEKSSITCEIIAHADKVIVGSRFDGLSTNDIPLWLKKLVGKDLILNINGTIPFYTGVESGWCPLRSTVPLSMLCRTLNLYAPVNFDIAAEPYVIPIESVPWPTIIMGNTFTQGRLRYSYTIDNDSGVVKFTPNILIGKDATSKNTLCSIPVSNVNPVLQFNINFSSVRACKNGALAWLYRVFGTNVDTILWALGDMLYGSNNKRLFIMYGPGGVGKSTVANIMHAVIGGTIPTIGSDLVCMNLKSYHQKILSKSHLVKVASSRIISLGDVEPKPDSVLHMQNIKLMTGGDEAHGMKVHTTLVMTANKLFHYSNLNDYVRPDRSRRVVVVPSVAERD